MKKTILLFSAIALCILGIAAQTTLEVGPDKTFTTLVSAFTAANEDVSTDIIIKVAAGTYIETDQVKVLANKKITVIGSGADKTIIRKSDSETFALPGTDGFVPSKPNRLFNFSSSDNKDLDLTFEKLTFKTMGFNDANGGGFINVTDKAGSNFKFTFRHCVFNNIMARAGGIIQTQLRDPLLSITFEDCFIENCGVFDNNGMNALIFYQSGTLTIKNTTFMNNAFNAFNSGNKETGTDRNLRSSVLINGDKVATNLSIENSYVVNNKFLFADTDKTHPLIAMNSRIGADSIVIIMNDVISVGNIRPASLDCDFYYQNTVNPFINNSIFNAVKNYDLIINEDETTTNVDADVTILNGAVIDPSLTYTSPEINFEMDETTNLPKIFVNESTGVKYLKRLITGLSDNKLKDLNISIVAGKLSVTSPKLENISIYNIMGAQVAVYHQVNNIEVSLPAGAYILRTASQVVKVLVK